ncbi:MAG: rhodanese-like domain-containing protein [Phycisphaeraceae bacterium]|nr:rhodanese-like domain-containing protein [Phycisphaeraceae bacterium]MCW5763334.1 rhodanese-like domain-containing protein [Phycisphaeraceae bacterium]
MTDKDIQYVDVAALRQMLNEKERDPMRVIVLDARPLADYNAGHIPTARSLRPADFHAPAGVDPAIGQHSSIVVYGTNPGSGVAKGVTKELLKMRMKRARMFDGGIEAWTRAGYPLESSQ